MRYLASILNSFSRFCFFCMFFMRKSLTLNSAAPLVRGRDRAARTSLFIPNSFGACPRTTVQGSDGPSTFCRPFPGIPLFQVRLLPDDQIDQDRSKTAQYRPETARRPPPRRAQDAQDRHLHPIWPQHPPRLPIFGPFWGELGTPKT